MIAGKERTMKTVRIISGTYGADNGKGGVIAISRGETCEVDDQEAARLVSIGVASVAVATAQETQAESEASEDMSERSDTQSGVVGRLDANQLLAWTNAQLEQLAEDMGLDVSKCKKKSDYIELITSEDVIIHSDCVDGGDDEDTIDDGELPPNLEAEAPVE